MKHGWGGIACSWTYLLYGRAASAAGRESKVGAAPPRGKRPATGMKPARRGLRGVTTHRRVELRRANVRGAEKPLPRAQVGPAGKQMCGETVAQRVRTHLAARAGTLGIFL